MSSVLRAFRVPSSRGSSSSPSVAFLRGPLPVGRFSGTSLKASSPVASSQKSWFCNAAEGFHHQQQIHRRFAFPGSTSSGGALLLLGGLGLGLAMASWMRVEAEEAEDPMEAVKRAGKARDDLPNFSLEEVKQHGAKADRIWVTYREAVYDITDFIELHPGQDKILLAAGGAIDPFWAMYGQHLTAQVVGMLEELRIGNLRPEDRPALNAISLDPYAAEPTRDPRLVVRGAKPFNAESPLWTLGNDRLTPTELFYVRHHLPVPVVDPTAYRLSITSESEPEKVLNLTLDDLKNSYKKVTVAATVQCAGNRRNEMGRYKEVKGGSWEIGAVSNAEWTGATLRDVLLSAGIDPDNLDGKIQHIQFEALDRDMEKSYGASIPVQKGVDPKGDVILAYEMNGEEITRDHGYPVRVIVPGIVGARNVKWVHKIHLSNEESHSHWQRKDYKAFGPNIDWSNAEGVDAPSIQEMPVSSCITEPEPGNTLPTDMTNVEVKGYAWSGGGKGIIRVDVSADGGNTWQQAQLRIPNQEYNRVWEWTQWSTTVAVPKDHQGSLKLCCKAVDSSYNTQPEMIAPIWNLRGFLNNAWHRVDVTIDSLKK